MRIRQIDRADFIRRDRQYVADHCTDVDFKCPVCGDTSTIRFEREYYEKGMKMRAQGALIQDAFPESSSEIRETMISGMCPICQFAIFEEPQDWWNPECIEEWEACCAHAFKKETVNS